MMRENPQVENRRYWISLGNSRVPHTEYVWFGCNSISKKRWLIGDENPVQ